MSDQWWLCLCLANKVIEIEPETESPYYTMPTNQPLPKVTTIISFIKYNNKHGTYIKYQAEEPKIQPMVFI